jgi:predicted Rossmann-fold nucleotide-binding protein
MSTPTSITKGSHPVGLADDDGAKDILVSTVFGLWAIVNNLTRLRPSKRERYRVTIFGSASAKPETFAYNELRHAAAAQARMGCDIITGGGSGLTQAANEGAAEADRPERNRSVGIRVDLPFEQEANPFVEQAFEHRTFFTRLHHFVLASDAFAVAPGGIGTVLEATMIWQGLQVGHTQDTPLLFMGQMWADLAAWAKRHMLSTQPPLANPEDMLIPRCLNTAEEAIALISEHYTKWLQEQNK